MAYVFLIILCVAGFRPAIFGEHYGGVTYIVTIGMFLYLGKVKFFATRHGLFFLFCLLGLTSIALFHLVFNSSNKYIIVASFAGLFSGVVAGTLFSSPEKYRLFNNVFVKIITSISLISGITYLLVLFDMKFGSISIQTHQTNFIEGYANFYSPFGIIGADKKIIVGFELMRNFGVFREPGIFQMYICVALAILFTGHNDIKSKKTHFAILSFALFTTLSGAAIASLGAVILFLRTAVLPRGYAAKSGVLLASVISFYLLIGPVWGFLEGKLYSETGLTRFGVLYEFSEIGLVDLIIGKGLMQKLDVDTINLLGSLVGLGLSGGFFYLLPWVYMFIFGKKEHSAPLIPIFVTLLLFQPIFLDPFVWFMLAKAYFQKKIGV
ncbi:hypothetical protein N9Y51_03605 [Alphaproteobacteria bacterium]|nr:hypothetical protein [Alphaproteobacteria bacterium]